MKVKIMPSTITHSYFIMDLYEKLPISRKIFLKDQKENLKTFAQSTDPLNFYFSLNFKKSKKIRSFAYFFHTKKTNEYLITLINYIKYNYYKDSPEIMAYLYSMISHYILDSKIHPYVYYKTGIFTKNNNKSYKYNGKHLLLETNIDKYLIKTKEKTLPKKYKHYNLLFNATKYSKELIDVINFSFRETFNINNFDKILLRSIKNMKLSFRWLRYDRFGIKANCYRLIDKISTKKCTKLSFLSYYENYKDSSFLNNEKKTWYYPTNKRKKQNKSFIELYIEALHETLDTIKKIDSYIYDNKKINLEFLLKNNSYVTGININKDQKMKHFEN